MVLVEYPGLDMGREDDAEKLECSAETCLIGRALRGGIRVYWTQNFVAETVSDGKMISGGRS